jgi:hypothetical protein
MRKLAIEVGLFGVLAAGASTQAGCVVPALKATASDNASVSVEYLFTHDGCRVYRFLDGQYHYFVRCDPPATSAATFDTRGCGKDCVVEETIPTVTPARPVDGSAGTAPPARR